jgi:hypothetical protein
MMNQNTINTSTYDYGKHALIPPPESILEGTKHTRIAIDSKDRNRSLYAKPNSYVINLDSDVNDVISAKLINADIPMSMYLINKFFDTITLVFNGTTYQVKLEHGNYNENEFAAMVTMKFNTISAETFNVSYNRIRDGFTFGSTQPFSLIFGNQANSLEAMIGFGKETYNATATGSAPYTYEVRSVYRKNFNFNNCVIMYIEQFDNYISPSEIMDRCFAILPSVYNWLSIADHPELIKSFSPPIPRLNKLIISFYDRYGNPYDFQNMEHRFELVLTSHKQARRYTIFGN